MNIMASHLNTTEEGILRLVVVSPKNNQVVDGHWSVKWVNKVEAKAVGQVMDLGSERCG